MGNLRKTRHFSLLALLWGSVVTVLTSPTAMAQELALPTCKSPEANEFLVLVFTPSEPLREEVKLQVGRTLPKAHDLLVCQYGGNALSRVGGFGSQQKATEWAEYFDEAVGLPSMVITPVNGSTTQAVTNGTPPSIPVALDNAAPPDVIVPTEVATPNDFQQQLKPERMIPVASITSPPATAIAQATTPPTFQPQALVGGGYGVLVDYGANPQIAAQLKALTQRDVGLVVYGGRGYLLAAQAADSTQATTLLDTLNAQGLLAIA
ncbi:MAG: hypothetical protein HC799_08950, partial [Limnothrix sp. RL_2_0]|nr:hypothetical protein [Limnothrix sp. RL_2_0]